VAGLHVTETDETVGEPDDEDDTVMDAVAEMLAI
jgi:hypothetical protein